MLSKLKFLGKVLSDTVTGTERFSFKYLYEYELKHITITLTKDNLIMPKFREAGKGRDELTVAEKEIDHKKKVTPF